MQRVSSLLPLWERGKSGSGSGNSNGSGNGSGSGNDSSSAAGSTGNAGNRDSVNNRSSIASNTSTGNAANAAASNRNSGTRPATRQSRPLHKVFSWADRIGVRQSSAPTSPSSPPANATGNSPASPSVPRPMGREAYWPSTLDHECEKAARILKSFCTDGFLDEAADSIPLSPTSRTSMTSLTSPRFSRPSRDVPPSPTTSLSPVKKKIPPRIIQDAVGLAIFSCMRSGLWMSGSGGSGILIARKADGTWSPPSGILLHTSTVAFVLGVDIYDCVLVINSVAALEMFTHPRLTLGADVPLTVGPLVTMGLLENDVRFNYDMGNTVLTYLKARGRHSPAQLAGSLVTERSNENARFYSNEAPGTAAQPIDILSILAGRIPKSIPEILPLFEAIKAAEGRIDFDSAVMERLSQQPAPGDADISDIPDTPSSLTPASPTSATFGVPDAADPDPFGIIALEMAGLEIREAGSKHRPSSHQFDYTASPTSPLFSSRFSHQSAEPPADLGNRASLMSARTQATSVTDAYTQTDVAETPDTSMSPTHSDDGKDSQATAPIVAASAVAATASIAAVATTVATTAPTATTTVATPEQGPSAVPEVAVQAPLDNTDAVSTDNDVTRVPSRATASESTDAEPTITSGGLLAVDDALAASSHEKSSDTERNEDADDEDDLTDDAGAEFTDGGLDDDEFDDLEDEEPVIFEVATTTQPVRAVPSRAAQVIQAKGAIVTIPKRVPPPLPLRSPHRSSRNKAEIGDFPNIGSPLRNSFQSARSTQSMRTPEPTVGRSGDEQHRTHSLDVSAVRAKMGENAAISLARSPSASPAPSRTTLIASCVPETASSATKQAAEPTAASSSVDESECEPQTPRPDDVFKDTHLQTSSKAQEHEDEYMETGAMDNSSAVRVA